MRPSIGTFTGLLVDIQEPTPDMIRIVDIAHATSNQCRWGGHCKTFYSVAQHMVASGSVAIMQGLPLHRQKQAFLHDGSEGYLIDFVTPIKRLMPEYYEVESKFQRAIGAKFDVELDPLSPEVKEIDLRMLVTEAVQLGHPELLYDVPNDVRPYDLGLVPLPPERARELFLRMYCRLWNTNVVEVAA